MTVNRSDFQRRFKAEPDSGDRFIGQDTDDGSADPFVTDLAGMAGGLAPLIAVDTELSSRYGLVAPQATGTAATDTAALQAAITAAAGGRLIIPAGSYVVNASLKIGSNTHIVMTRGTIITLANASNTDVFTNASWSAGNTDIHIEGGYLNGNRAGQTSAVGDGPGQSLISLVNVTRFTVRNVRGTSPFLHGIDCNVRDIAANSYSDPGCTDGLIQDCEFTDFGDDGITTHWSAGIAIVGCKCWGAAASYSGSSNGFEIDDGSSDITLTSCISHNNRSGFMVQGHAGRIPARRITLTGCIAYTNERAGFIASQTTSAHGDEAARGVTINGGSAYDNYYGVQVENYRSVTINGLVIDTATHGFYINETIAGTITNLQVRGGEMLSASNKMTLLGTAVLEKIGTIRDMRGYVPTDERVWIDARRWQDTVGSPNISITTASGKSVPVYLLDPAAGSENITCCVSLPAGWLTADADVYWTEPSGGTGDVVWRMDRQAYAEGATTNAETTGSNVTATAPAQYTLKVTTVLSDFALDPTNPLLRLELLRLGSNASDTLTSDAAVLGVMLRRKS
jgi:hypothetical protein